MPETSPLPGLALLDAFADHLSDGVVALDGSGRIHAMNRAARAQHGLEPDAPLPPTLAALAGCVAVHAPDGPALPPEAWPHARATRGDAFTEVAVDLVEHASGRRRRCAASAAPVSRNSTAPDGTAPDGLAMLTLRDLEAPSPPEAAPRRTLHWNTSRWYSTLFDAIDDEVLVYHLDADGHPDRLVEVNPEACRRLGYTREELLGKRVSDLVDPSAVDVADALERLHRDGHVVVDSVHRTRDGRALPVETRAALFDLDGRPTVVSVCRDRTEPYRREAALRERARHFATIANSIPQVVWFARRDGAFTYANAYWYSFTGLDASGTLGAAWLQAVHPDHRERVRGTWREATERETPYEIEIPLRHGEDGCHRWHVARGLPLRGAGGAIDGWVGVALDIHDRRLAEEQTRFLADLAAALQPLDDPDAVIATAARLLGTHLDADRCAYALVEDDEDHFVVTGEYRRGDTPSVSGRHRMSAFGQPVYGRMLRNEVFVVRDVADEPALRGALGAFAGMQIRAAIAVPLHKAGRFVATMAVQQAVPRAWTEREVDLVLAVANRCWEAFERARAEAALLENERRLRLAQEVGRVGVFEWIIPENRNIWSPELEQLYGLEPGTFEGDFASWRRRVVPEDADRVEAGIARSLADAAADYAYEFRAVLPDGTHRWLHAQARFYYDAEGEPFRMIGVNVDVDERKRAEEALRYSEERYRLAARATNDAIWDWDLRTGVVSWNRAVADLFGWEEAEAGSSSDWWKARIHPDDRRRATESIHTVIEGGGEHWQTEYRFERSDGTYAPVFDRGYVLRRADGTPLRMVGAMLDLTEMKRSEAALRESEQRLRQLNASLETRVQTRTSDLRRAVGELESRNQELQDFAYVASHDLQEPLRKISVFSDLLLSEAADRLEADERAYIGRMQHAAQRMTALIQGLLAYSRVQTQGQAFRPVDVGALVGEVLGDLEVAIAEADARVEVNVQGVVEADPTQLRQLVQNLVGNALKFRAPDVSPLVTVRSRIDDEGDEATFVLEVSDNGIGFEARYAERIFAPFQRLHGRSAYPGTGIGLAICRRIAERHGGTIQVASVPGEGSTFTVRLRTAHPPGRATDDAETLTPGDTSDSPEGRATP